MTDSSNDREVYFYWESFESGPLTPLPEKVQAFLRAERAKWARLDPEFRAELERRGIHLSAEELQDKGDS